MYPLTNQENNVNKKLIKKLLLNISQIYYKY